MPELSTRDLAVPWARRDWIMLLVLVVGVFSLYVRTCRFDFIDFDDNVYIYDNPHIIGGPTFDNVSFSVTQTVLGNWHPLTTLSWLVIESISGPGAAGFHFANTVLHTVNVALLFVFLRRATGRFWAAAFTATLWGMHPLRVESVAWVSELKDVLCGCMWLLCMLANLRYARKRTVGGYIIVLLLQALALLAKPMAVTLPVALLLLDYWPLRYSGPSVQSRVVWWRNRILEKLPLLILAAGVIVAAAMTQQQALGSFAKFPVSLRIENALVSVTAYISDTFYPAHLCVFYPHPAMLDSRIPFANAAVAAALLAMITIIVIVRARSRAYLLVGWLWFILTLLPVLGLLQVGEQSRADRYTYIPSIGLTMAIVWLAADLAGDRFARRVTAVAVGCVAAFGLAVVTAINVGYWRNTTTLFTRADQAVPDNFLAKAVLAYGLRDSGHRDEAMRLAVEATRLSPHALLPHYTLGLLLLDANRFDEAAKALSIRPMTAKNWYALGLVSSAEAKQYLLDAKPGDINALKRVAIFRTEACDCFRHSLGLDPDNLAAQDLLADQTNLLGRHEQAIQIWTDLIRQAPGYGLAHGHLGDALRASGQTSDALEQYRLAIALNERDPSWETIVAFSTASDPQASPREIVPMIAVATDARDQTGGKDPATLDALAACLARVGRFDDAVIAARAAVEQATLQKKLSLVKDIQHRLMRYQNGLSYVEGN